jgi:hypothetical protein
MECTHYFRDIVTDSIKGDWRNYDLLDYWRDKKDSGKYHYVCLAARKWVSVPASSTPSERVWSICGMLDNPKRNRMDGKKLEAQAMIHNNYHALAPLHSKIEERTIAAMTAKRQSKKG